MFRRNNAIFGRAVVCLAVIAGLALRGSIVTPRPALALVQQPDIGAGDDTGSAAVTTVANPCEGKFCPEIDIPGLFQGPQTVDNSLAGRYIRAVYIYLVWTVGILATVMVIWGGIKWVAAAGNPTRIADARDTINNAIIGVIIALTSVLMLRLINPAFITLSLPSLTSVSPVELARAHAAELCPPSFNVGCGEKRVTGVDKSNQQTFCMGTKCSQKNPATCNIDRHEPDKAGESSYYIAIGCLPNVALSRQTSSAYGNISIMPLTDNDTECGRLDNAIISSTSVGLRCAFDSTRCIMIGQYANFDESTKRITNMCCAGDKECK